MSKKSRKATESISSEPGNVIDLAQSRPLDLRFDQIGIDAEFAKLLDPGDEKVAPEVKSPTTNVASDQVDPHKLPYMVHIVGLNCRALLRELIEGHMSHFDSPAKVEELRSGFESLKQIMDAIAPSTSSALDRELAPIPTPELSSVDGSPTPYKIVGFDPSHFDPRRDADNDLGPNARARAANTMFLEQRERFLSLLNGLEPLMQSIRDSAPNNLTTIERDFRNVCKGAETLGTDLILMTRTWKLRN